MLFEVLSENLILAKLKGRPMTEGDVFEQLLGQSEMQKKSKKTNNYWTLMDFEGKILEMPPEMNELLMKKDWATL